MCFSTRYRNPETGNIFCPRISSDIFLIATYPYIILNPWTEAHGDHSALIFKNQHGLDSQEYFSLKPVHNFYYKQR